MENENKLEMKLTMRLRTYSTHAIVMYARGTDYSILEVCVYTGIVRFVFNSSGDSDLHTELYL